MSKMKKIVAAILAVTTLMTATITAASAGGISDFFSGVGKTVAHFGKAAYHVVAGTVEMVTTSKSSSECYHELQRDVENMGDGLKKIGTGAVKTVKDIGEFQESMIQVVAGTAATAVTAVAETVVNTVSGSDNYNWTKATANYTKNGIDKFDRSVGTMEEIAKMTGPVGSAITTGTSVVREALYATTGYKNTTWSDVGKKAVEGVADLAIGQAVGGMSEAVGSVVGKTGGTILKTGVNTGVKIIKDLANPKDKRSATDIILEDVCTSVMKTATSTAVKNVCNSDSNNDENGSVNAKDGSEHSDTDSETSNDSDNMFEEVAPGELVITTPSDGGSEVDLNDLSFGSGLD